MIKGPRLEQAKNLSLWSAEHFRLGFVGAGESGDRGETPLVRFRVARTAGIIGAVRPASEL